MLGWFSEATDWASMPEAGDEVGVAAVLGPEDLDGDVAAELAVRGAVDGGHAALAEQLDQPIAAAEDASDLRQVLPSSARGLGRPARPGIVPASVTRRRRRVPRPR